MRNSEHGDGTGVEQEDWQSGHRGGACQKVLPIMKEILQAKGLKKLVELYLQKEMNFQLHDSERKVSLSKKFAL